MLDTMEAQYGRSPEKLHLSRRRITSDLTNMECAEHRVNYLTERIAFQTNPELLRFLIGPLYDYQPVYGIRELLQNSIDACHERQALCRSKDESYHNRVVLEFDSLPDGHAAIRVSDNGIGMTGDVIKNHYTVAGSSYRYDLAWKKIIWISIPTSTISTWYRKKLQPNIVSIEKICDGLGISLSYFF